MWKPLIFTGLIPELRETAIRVICDVNSLLP